MGVFGIGIVFRFLYGIRGYIPKIVNHTQTTPRGTEDLPLRRLLTRTGSCQQTACTSWVRRSTASKKWVADQ